MDPYGSRWIPMDPDQIKKIIYQKLIGGSNKLWFDPFLDPVGHIEYKGRLGVAGGAALQVVSECPRRR